MTDHAWDAALYDTHHGFVAALGADLLDLLDGKPGERVLDVGCGTGDHVAALNRNGVAAMGIDASPQMVQRARDKYSGLPVSVADVRRLAADAEFDAILSNAVLHWVLEPDQAATALVRALRPGGRFVAEFGGAGNVATIVDATTALRAAHGLPIVSSPWYYPTIGQYAAVLEDAGFEVRQASLFDRPTRLDGPHGMASWVRMFGGHLLTGVPDQDAFLAELEDDLRPSLWRDDAWWADYRRLRIVAVRPAA